jgi:hypothetical protein
VMLYRAIAKRYLKSFAGEIGYSIEHILSSHFEDIFNLFLAQIDPVFSEKIAQFPFHFFINDSSMSTLGDALKLNPHFN